MITYSTVPQGTDEWMAERCGLITASNASKIMGAAKTRETYLLQLAAERLYGPGAMEASFSNEWMKRGNELEPDARAAFEFEHDMTVKEVGLATNPAYPGCGASLDGLIGHDAGLEIKCPKASTLMGYTYRGGLPNTYRDQVVFQQLICDLKGTHFYAYHPAMAPLHIYVERDDKACQEVADKITTANQLIDKYKRGSSNA